MGEDAHRIQTLSRPILDEVRTGRPRCPQEKIVKEELHERNTEPASRSDNVSWPRIDFVAF
jgi:hypothetical protein